jgi:hypothetical protein
MTPEITYREAERLAQNSRQVTVFADGWAYMLGEDGEHVRAEIPSAPMPRHRAEVA